MKLSTSHSIMDKVDGDIRYTPFESLRAIKDAGYDRVDINFRPLCQVTGESMAGDNWAAVVEEFAAAADEVKIPIYQVHGDTMSNIQWDDMSYPRREMHFVCVHRTIEAARRLGATVLVLHPYNLAHAPLYSVKENRDACIAYLAPFIETAKKCGIKLAVENMIDFSRRHRRYCGGDIYELIDLVDTINDPSVGICFDTGHGNISGMNAGEAIRAIGGKRLLATHINDNLSLAGNDTHALPYLGDIDWDNVMKALHEIDYHGDFAYEIKHTRTPKTARADWLRYTVAIGRDLLAKK